MNQIQGLFTWIQARLRVVISDIFLSSDEAVYSVNNEKDVENDEQMMRVPESLKVRFLHYLHGKRHWYTYLLTEFCLNIVDTVTCKGWFLVHGFYPENVCFLQKKI